jgi:hypothetical protein
MKASRTSLLAILALTIAGLVQLTASAQEKNAPTTTKTQSEVHFEVIAVQGNTVTVKTQERGAHDVTVDDSFRFTVDGQPVSVHDLKPGMKGTATVTTTTTMTPVVVTEVHNGRVERVSGNSIIVSTPNGFRMFTEQDAAKRGAAIIRNGQPADFTSLRAGDVLTATVVTEHAPKVMTKSQVDAAMASPTPATPSAAATGAPPAHATPVHPAPAPSDTHAQTGTSGTEGAMSASTPHKKLPKTASEFPAIGLAGAMFCGIALMLGVVRRRTI